MGLLSDPRTMDIGMGLLSQGGPSFQPHNLGQDIAGAYQYANGREGQRQQLNYQRQIMAQRKSQQAAQKRLGGLLANRQSPQQINQNVMGQMGVTGGAINPQTANTAAQGGAFWNAANNQQQAQIPSLLMEAFPNQAGQVMGGLLGQNTQPKTSAKFNDWIASGGDPTDQEGYQEFSNPADPAADAEMGLLLERLRTATEERELKNTTYTQGQRSRARSVKTGIATIAGVAEAMDTVDGTFLAIGAPVPEWRRDAQGVYSFVKETAGFDQSQNNKVAAAFDTINKDLSGLLSDTIENFGGNMTVTQIGILKSASANPNIRPETVAGLLMDVLDDRLFTAENEGLDIGELEGMEELRGTLSRIKSGRGGGEPKKIFDWNDINGNGIPDAEE